MSKLIDATITCPKCGKQYPTKLFRTIWGEHEECRNMVMNDKINVPECPHCHFSFKAPFPFMYVDVNKGFAVWWEPYYDATIDEDLKGYASMFGADSYYAQAPRVKDWNEFKQTIHRYYTGELKANPITKFDLGALKQQKTVRQEKSGCLGVMLALLILPIAALSLFLIM